MRLTRATNSRLPPPARRPEHPRHLAAAPDTAPPQSPCGGAVVSRQRCPAAQGRRAVKGPAPSRLISSRALLLSQHEAPITRCFAVPPPPPRSRIHHV